MGKTSIKIIKKDRLSAIRHLIMVLFTHPYHFPSIMLNHFFFPNSSEWLPILTISTMSDTASIQIRRKSLPT